MENSYFLLDSGQGKKLERFGPYTLIRPASQAIWKATLPQNNWDQADGIFTRDEMSRWMKKIEKEWIVEVLGIKFRLSLTDFGHLGIFPEQKDQWNWIQTLIREEKKMRKTPIRVLNLFAYSGGATLVSLREGAEVCHLDASKGMVSWAKENAKLNALDMSPVRWIVDDVKKFLIREVRRKNLYDAIILDPPSFGRGSKGEVFKFEVDLYHILELCKKLLSRNPLFFLLSCHTPNISPTGLSNILHQVLSDLKGTFSFGEMLLKGNKETLPLPSGTFARWAA